MTEQTDPDEQPDDSGPSADAMRATAEKIRALNEAQHGPSRLRALLARPTTDDGAPMPSDTTKEHDQ